MFAEDENQTPDGMPMQKAPTLRLIFATQEDKEKFLELLSDKETKLGIQIGTSDEKTLLECDDVSVRFVSVTSI